MIINQISLKSYISTVTTITLSCGIVFQLPIIVYFLSKLGFVTPKLMRTYRRHAIIAVLILSAIITPPDISSQVLVSIPLVILYEVSILISKMVVKKDEENDS
jgi:sec-independent protein translocase protein TatC